MSSAKMGSLLNRGSAAGIIASCAFVVWFFPANSFASDINIYECLNDLGNELKKDEMFASMVSHLIYKFNFADNTVTVRVLDKDGKDAPLIGAVAKSSSSIKVNGNFITWTDDSDMGSSASMKVSNSFDVEKRELTQTTELTPPPEMKGQAGAEPMRITEMLHCTIYSGVKR